MNEQEQEQFPTGLQLKESRRAKGGLRTKSMRIPSWLAAECPKAEDVEGTAFLRTRAR
jgi:hypothetical protein